jgi:hypothetical protein
MISIDIDIAEEIIRIANSYAEELNNALETQDNSDEMIKYIEGDIANADILVSYIERKLKRVRPFDKSFT